jgi:hypothetical protein
MNVYIVNVVPGRYDHCMNMWLNMVPEGLYYGEYIVKVCYGIWYMIVAEVYCPSCVSFVLVPSLRFPP